MNRLVLTALAVGLFGCGGADPEQACVDYLAAVDSCFDEAGGSSPVNAAYCDAYSGLTGSAAKTASDLLDCYVQVLESGDCSEVPAANDTLATATGQCS